jgi:hypothetical protein
VLSHVAIDLPKQKQAPEQGWRSSSFPQLPSPETAVRELDAGWERTAAATGLRARKPQSYVLDELVLRRHSPRRSSADAVAPSLHNGCDPFAKERRMLSIDNLTHVYPTGTRASTR